MATPNLQYWGRRLEQRLTTTELKAEATIERLLPVYEQAFRNIEREVQSVYENYSKNGVLQIDELKKAIGPAGKKEFLRKISSASRKLGLDPSQIYDERYLDRLTRLEALAEQVKLEAMTVAPQSEVISDSAYRDIVRTNYSEIQRDIRNQGLTPAFGTIDKHTLDKIMSSVWQGGNYSSRIWGNTEKLAMRLPTILGSAFLTGQNYQKTQQQLRREFDVSVFEATRLVRTESNYFHNQAELQSYTDDGIERYEFMAILDSRTSKICRHLDGKIYFVKDAVAGVNYPPMHANCRSGTVPVFTDEDETRQRAARRTPKLGTTKRTQRFEESDNGELRTRWEKAMQKQMNPNKSAHDYNAEMNQITRSLKGEQLESALNDLMRRVPQDYPLRGGLEKVAEINGWTKPAITEATATVEETLQNSGIDPDQVKFTPEQSRFVADSHIKFENIRTNGNETMGIYQPQTNTLSIDVANVTERGNQLGDKNYLNRVLQHELGHAVDAFAPQLRNDTETFSASESFSKLVKGDRAETNEAIAISQYRYGNSIPSAAIRKNILEMSPEAYYTMARTSDTITVEGTKVGVPYQMYEYHVDPEEIFAEGYSLFHTNPEYLKDKAPKIFDFINSVTSRKL